MTRKWFGRLPRWGWKEAGRGVGALARLGAPVARPGAFALGFILVVLLIHREVYSFITERRQYTVPAVRVAAAPRWATAEVVEVRVAASNLMDDRLVESVGRAFEKSPWVRRVVGVERAYPDRLMVRLEYRQPHLAIKRTDGHVLVDRDGMRLPGVYADPPTCERNVRISGVASAPPASGRVWNDPAVRVAAEMADLVAGNKSLQDLGIEEIDVSNVGGRVDPRRSEVALVSSRGCALQWGRAPSMARFGELSTDEKVDNLRRVLAAYPGLEGLRSARLYVKGSCPVERQDAWVQRR